MVILPISLENQIVPGSLENTINEVVEKHVDLSVSANLCVHKRMSRFTLRTKRKVDVLWRLYATVLNSGKICVFETLNSPQKGKRIVPVLHQYRLLQDAQGVWQGLSAPRE